MKSIEGSELTPKQLARLDAGETCTFAARLGLAAVGLGAHWDTPTLLVTDRRLLISKEKLVGKRKADFETSWPEISGVRCELWNGGDPRSSWRSGQCGPTSS